MKVVIIGSGGREHALCHFLHKSKEVTKVFCFPGNAGTSTIAENISLDLNNFDEIKTLFPDKTEIEVVIRPCLPRADLRVPGGLILRKFMVCFPIIRFFPVLTKLQETFGGCDVFTAAKLKYGDHQSSSSWKWFCVPLLMH